MTAPPTPTLAEQYPIRNVRFVNGRTHHRTKRPIDERWWDLLEAACGKTGFLARGYPGGAIRECRGCARAIAADKAGPQATPVTLEPDRQPGTLTA